MALPADSDLVARCLVREQGAWEALVDRYSDLVYGIARRAGLDGPAAEDVIQDVFLALLKNLKRLRQHDRLMGWVVKTTRRESWRAARRFKSRRARDEASSRPDEDVAPLPDVVVEEEERRHFVRRALAALESKCQRLLDALFLREVGDYQALSVELGMPVGSIGPTRKRCLEKMLRELEALGFPHPEVSAAGGSASGVLGPPGGSTRAS